MEYGSTPGSEALKCVERDGGERSEIAIVANRKPPASPGHRPDTTPFLRDAAIRPRGFCMALLSI
jgi:hypothetical protein